MHSPGMEYYKSNQPAGPATQTPTSNFEHANLLLVNVGGADHRIPRFNHLTLFGSVVSVVEFPRTTRFFVGCFRSFSSGVVTIRCVLNHRF